MSTRSSTIEAELAQPCLVREIRRRNALVDAALDQRVELGAFGVRESRVEKRVEPVERKVERVQNEVDRLVVTRWPCRARKDIRGMKRDTA